MLLVFSRGVSLHLYKGCLTPSHTWLLGKHSPCSQNLIIKALVSINK